jgi:hypothetical protein
MKQKIKNKAKKKTTLPEQFYRDTYMLLLVTRALQKYIKR